MKAYVYIILCLTLSLTSDSLLAQDHYVWQHAAPMNHARMGHAAVASNGKIFVFGGITTDRRRALRSVEVYNPRTDEWEFARDLPEPLFLPSAVSFGNSILIFGGFSPDSGLSSSVMRYDIEEDSYRFVARLSGPARYGIVTLKVGDRILVMGGFDEEQHYQNVAYWYDPQRGTWSQDDRTRVNGGSFAMTYGADHAWVVGGFDRGPLNRLWRLRENRWEERESMSNARGRLTAVFLADTLVAAGGNGRRGEIFRSVEGYLPEEDEWFEMPELLYPRSDFTLVNLMNRLYAIGGFSRTDRGMLVLDKVDVFLPVDLSVDVSNQMNPELFSLNAFPNPSNKGVTFVLPDIDGILSIMNLQGHILEMYDLPGVKRFSPPEISKLTNGIYYYTFTTKTRRLSSAGSFIILK